MSGISRTALFAAPWLVASLLAGCSADSPTGSTRSPLWVDPSATCQIFYTPLKNGMDYVGSIDVINTSTELTIEVQGTGGYLLNSVTVRAGTSAPSSPSDLPYVTSYSDTSFASHVFHIPLSSLSVGCGDTVYLAVEATATIDSTTITAWGKGTTCPVGPGSYFSYDICCEQDAGVPTCDAGPPPPPPPSGCTLTQGYWKNHPDAWPVSSLQLGLVTYTEAQLITLLQMPTEGDASLILADQLIAALLNVASGATPPSSPVDIGAAIDDALTFLAGYSGSLPYGIDPSSGPGHIATQLAETLASFNEGNAGVLHCSD